LGLVLYGASEGRAPHREEREAEDTQVDKIGDAPRSPWIAGRFSAPATYEAKHKCAVRKTSACAPIARDAFNQGAQWCNRL